ncbi:MAG: glycosyltransferase family 2 protein [Anaerolineales bacterium]
MMDIGVVIVNWNTCGLLRRCLQTVLASEGVALRVVVVDNASTDGSPEMVSAEFPQVALIANPTNDGFSAANNLGLRHLGFGQPSAPDAPRYALILNPDTELPADALQKMVHYMDAEPRMGAAGPKLVLPDGSLDLACRRSFPTPMVSFYRFSGLGRLFPHSRIFGQYNMTYLSPDVETEVDSVVGAFMMVRRDAIDAVGLLNERFFMYAEDIEWAYRIKQANWTIYYNPAVTVLHVKRAASRQNPRTRGEFHRASLMFYRMHYRHKTAWPLHLMILSGLLLKGGRRVWHELWNPSHT